MNMKNTPEKIEAVRGETVVIDSDDVRRAQDLAIKRGHAAVQQEIVDGKTVGMEIITDSSPSGSVSDK